MCADRCDDVCRWIIQTTLAHKLTISDNCNAQLPARELSGCMHITSGGVRHYRVGLVSEYT